jgi:hypothetical protein
LAWATKVGVSTTLCTPKIYGHAVYHASTLYGKAG